MNSFGATGFRNRTFLWPIYFLALVTLVSEWRITSIDSRAQFGIGSVAKTWLHQDVFLSFTKMDMGVILLCSYVMLTRRSGIPYIRLDRTAKKFLALCGIVIAFSILIALANSVSNPFSFFRPIAHFTMTLMITRYLVAQVGARRKIIRFINSISGLYMTLKMILFLSGNGNFVPEIGFVSTYDSYAVYVVLLATLLNLNLVLAALHKKKNPATSNLLLTIVGISFSLSTFIRTIWLVIAIALVLCVNSRNNNLVASGKKSAKGIFVSPRFLGGLIAIAIICLFIFAPSFNSRFNSMHLWSSSASTELGGSDNGDHLLDIQNGLAAVKMSPILGSGLGASLDVSGYSYKSKSFGFHNAPLTVWYWTGFAGFVLWILFPFQIWKWSKMTKYEDELVSCFAKSVRIWFCSIFIATSFFSAWPMTSIQFSIFLGLVIACITPNQSNVRGENLVR